MTIRTEELAPRPKGALQNQTTAVMPANIYRPRLCISLQLSKAFADLGDLGFSFLRKVQTGLFRF
jgi:hypothetical protein